MKLPVRLDINFEKGKPVLSGLWIKGFGWIVSGASKGKLTIHSEIDLNEEVGSDSNLLNKFIKNIKTYDKQGFMSVKCFKVES